MANTEGLEDLAALVRYQGQYQGHPPNDPSSLEQVLTEHVSWFTKQRNVYFCLLGEWRGG